MARGEVARVLLDIRWKVPRDVHPETFAQKIRDAIDNRQPERLSGLVFAAMNWAHPEYADKGWKTGKAADYESFLLVLSQGPQFISRFGIEEVGSHKEQVKKARKGYEYTYHRPNGQFASHRYRQRYPHLVTRRRHDVVRVDYLEVDAPDFEVRMEYDLDY